MAQDHPFLDDIPAYALGALDADQARVMESHLQTCEICRSELASYRLVVKDLLLASIPKKPPTRIRQQIQRYLSEPHQISRLRSNWSFGRLALGIIMLLLVVLNIISISQIQVLRREQVASNRRLDNSQSALALLASAGTKSILIDTGIVTGNLLINQNHNSAVILLWDLPELLPDQTYQAWLIDSEGGRTSAGIFQSDTGFPYTSKQLISPGQLSNFVGLGVTVEPAGGSHQPTGQRIFKIDY